MSRFTFTALATATLLIALPVSAQTVLKFSHTDQQAGARDPYKLWGWVDLYPGVTVPSAGPS